MGRFAIPAVALVMAALLYLLMHGAGDTVEPIALSPAQDAAVLPPPPIHTPVVVKDAPDAALLLDESQMTREDVLRVGLIGREVRWLDALMSAPSWRRDDDAEAPTWISSNGVRLAWNVRDGRVLGAEAQFPRTALSADLTALSGVFVGEHDHLPVHGEAFHEADTRLKTGDFVGQNGQRYYYRMRLSDQGEAPYGPEWFEVSLRPLRDE